MESSAPSSPADAREAALAVVRRLRESGHAAYFAGGCVRDLLLQTVPKDYDVATDAKPDRVRSLFSRTQAVGAAFGVILVRHSKSVIEVATFRADGPYTDGRRPDAVQFTTAEADAQRRDFTINGLFFDPIEYRVIDYVGGQADLAAKRIRAIGEPAVRFHEDHLRLLRAVRFASRLGFEIEPATRAAIVREAANLARISPERIADELRRMLTPATRNAAAVLLEELELLPVLMRFVAVPGDPARAPASLSIAEPTAIFRSLDASPAESISFGLALAALAIGRLLLTKVDPLSLFHPSAIKQLGREMRQTLKISNEELDTLQGSLAFGHLLEPTPPRVAQLHRFLATPFVGDAFILLKALRASGVLAEPIGRLLASLVPLAGKEHSPPPLLTGDDLTAAGFAPGPKFKRVLDEMYDEQLEGRVSDREAAIARASQLMG